VVLGGLPTSSGCSYLFVTAPQGEGRYAVAGDCTSNVAAPVIDTILTSTNAFSTLYVAGQSNVKNQGQAIGVGLLATAFWLSSSIYGYYNTSKCAELRADEGPGPYRRPVRRRRTVLSGPGGPETMQPDPSRPPSQPQANPMPPQAYPAPLSQPAPGGGGAGGTTTPAAPLPQPVPGAGGAGGSMAPAAPPAARPAVPPVRQRLDQDDPG